MYPATPLLAAAESTPVANWLAASWDDSPQVWDPQSDTEEWDSAGSTNGSTGDDEWDNHSDVDEGESQGGPTVVGAMATDGEELWDNLSDVDEGESQDGPTVVGAMATDGEELWDNLSDVDEGESQGEPTVVGAIAWDSVANLVLYDIHHAESESDNGAMATTCDEHASFWDGDSDVESES